MSVPQFILLITQKPRLQWRLRFPQINGADLESDDEEVDAVDDDLDNTKLVPIFTNAISFQKRQALG